MGTIASGTWDTPYKPRPKYKMYDTKTYELITVYEATADQYMFLGNGGDSQIIRDWIHTDEGEYLIHKVKEPEVITQVDHVMARYNCWIQAYIAKDDLLMYTLKFGAK